MLRTAALAVLATLLAIACPSPASAADKDCSDFPNQAAAEAWLNATPGDPDRLDGDSDGIACEALPCPCAGPGVPPVAPPPLPPPPPPPPPPRPAVAAQSRSVAARVISVVDGDTLKVRLASGARSTVRLIGIDTPETKKPGTPVQCGGVQATARMKKLALRGRTGRTVTITTDPTQDTTDRYGRLLAYVGAAGSDLGRSMVASGWATTYVYAVDFQRVARYRAAERSARSARKGVHGMCASNFHRAA